MSDIVLAALALMLVIEGILPFTARTLWREAFAKLIEMSDGQIRFIGLASVGIGAALLAFAR